MDNKIVSEERDVHQQRKNSYIPILILCISMLLIGTLLGVVISSNSAFKMQIAHTTTYPTFTPTATMGKVTPTPTIIKTASITFPTPNATLCIGENYTITWIAPADTQSVALNIYPPSGLPQQITYATDPGISEGSAIKGSFVWTAGRTLTRRILDSDPGYRIGLTVNNGSANSSGGNFGWGNYFTLTTCR